VLDKLKFGNEGARQKGRYALPAMTEGFIDEVCRECARVLKPSGYLMRWIDTFGLCAAHHLRVAIAEGKLFDKDKSLKCVDLIAWDNLRPGMGKRSRRRGDYLLVLQKPPISAKTWTDHGIPSRWPEKVPRDEAFPHIKPIGLITRLIKALTAEGDVVIDPAAGSFVVMRAAHALGRNFYGCDLAYDETVEDVAE
jgi:site-specific DNA-methyltransferase (adenine-specific)